MESVAGCFSLIRIVSRMFFQFVLQEFTGVFGVCAIVRKNKMTKLIDAGFKPTGVSRWVEGLLLSKWDREELWVGLNKTAGKKK